MFVTALPLYHVFALTANCFTPIMLGAANLLIPDPRNLAAFAKALSARPFTIITGVNTLFNAMLNDKAFAKRRLLDVEGGAGGRHGGAARRRRTVEGAHRQAAD